MHVVSEYVCVVVTQHRDDYVIYTLSLHSSLRSTGYDVKKDFLPPSSSSILFFIFYNIFCFIFFFFFANNNKLIVIDDLGLVQ